MRPVWQERYIEIESHYFRYFEIREGVSTLEGMIDLHGASVSVSDDNGPYFVAFRRISSHFVAFRRILS
jgi:hypothetical protein